MGITLLANVSELPKRFQSCGFKNFEVNEENKNLYEACHSWRGEESMTLTGKPGTGKTHLAIAMLRNFPMQRQDINNQNWIKQEKERELKYNDLEQEHKKRIKEYLDAELWRYKPANCLFIPVVELFLRLNEAALSDDGKMNLLNSYISNYYDCICLDDLGAEKLTEAKRENLYYIVDGRYRNMAPTIITSNFTIQEIAETEPRIASRLAEMGKVLHFKGTDYRKTKLTREKESGHSKKSKNDFNE